MPLEMEFVNNLTISILPFIAVITSGIIALWLKDFIAKLAKGLTFSMNKSFNEGDKVILDNEEALIVKIGITQTVFGIIKESGDYVWRYVPNERIDFLKLEKVIFDNTPHNNYKHINGNENKINQNTQQISKIVEVLNKMEGNKNA